MISDTFIGRPSAARTRSIAAFVVSFSANLRPTAAAAATAVARAPHRAPVTTPLERHSADLNGTHGPPALMKRHAESQAFMRDSAQETEGEGFEPSIRLATDNGFRDRRIRPLCHPSEAEKEGFEPSMQVFTHITP